MGRIAWAVAAGYLTTILLMTALFAGLAVTNPDAFSGDTLPPGTIGAVLLWGLGAGAAGGAITAHLTDGPYRGPLLVMLGLCATMGIVASAMTAHPHCWYRLGLVSVQLIGAWFTGRWMLARGARGAP